MTIPNPKTLLHCSGNPYFSGMSALKHFFHYRLQNICPSKIINNDKGNN